MIKELRALGLSEHPQWLNDFEFLCKLVNQIRKIISIRFSKQNAFFILSIVLIQMQGSAVDE
jgi:hypothetical protein